MEFNHPEPATFSHVMEFNHPETATFSHVMI